MEILKPGNCGIVCFDEFEQIDSGATDAQGEEALLQRVRGKCETFAKGLCKIDRLKSPDGMLFKTNKLKEEKEN